MRHRPFELESPIALAVLYLFTFTKKRSADRLPGAAFTARPNGGRHRLWRMEFDRRAHFNYLQYLQALILICQHTRRELCPAVRASASLMRIQMPKRLYWHERVVVRVD